MFNKFKESFDKVKNNDFVKNTIAKTEVLGKELASKAVQKAQELSKKSENKEFELKIEAFIITFNHYANSEEFYQKTLQELKEKQAQESKQSQENKENTPKPEINKPEEVSHENTI